MNPDENTNEFELDSPEAHQAAAVQQETATPDAIEQPLPPADDISVEAPAADVPPAPVAQVAVVDRSTVIPGLKEEAGNSVEDKALATKIKLAAEPKVRMMIPLDPGEKVGAYRSVILNGYRFDVRKNTMVDLPESVASMLAKAYSITTDVVENNPLNLAHADAGTQSALGV